LPQKSQLQHALDLIYRQHSRGYRHDYFAGNVQLVKARPLLQQ
jgi:hypothetical protein